MDEDATRGLMVVSMKVHIETRTDSGTRHQAASGMDTVSDGG